MVNGSVAMMEEETSKIDEGSKLSLEKNQKTDSISGVIVQEQVEISTSQKKRRKVNLSRKKEKGVRGLSLIKHSDDLPGDQFLSTIPGDVEEVRPEKVKRRRKSKVTGHDRSFTSPKDNEEEIKCRKLKSNRKYKQKDDKGSLHEASKLQRRARYLLVKMKLEQNLIDAYSGEGWKGQSREKIRPEKELQRARKQILKCKLGIRDIIRQLDMLSSVGKIDESLIAPDGSVHHEHIYCAKCKLQDVSQDNDIILCDGTCNCAYHQKCLDPPLETENIPPEEEGWLCMYCKCKMEILEAMNAHLGTEFFAYSSWKDIFREEASLPNNEIEVLNGEEEWPDDDSEDNDYDPDRDENDACRSTIGDGDSDDGSSSSSLHCSSDGEMCLESGSLGNQGRTFKSSSPMDYAVGQDSDGQADHEIVSGPRRRDAVDYKMLYDEMFGKDSAKNDEVSEDEDWGPSCKPRKKQVSDAANTLMALGDGEKRPVDNEVGTERLQNSRRRKFRIPVSIVEKLREVFAENELPSRDVKEQISQQFGLEYEKVNKWFKNSRYAALKTRKVDVVEGRWPSPTTTSNKQNLEAATDDASKSVDPLHKVKRSRKVSWGANRMSLLNPLKLQQDKRASLSVPPQTTNRLAEPSDNVSLKQRSWKKPGFHESCRAKEAEQEMETICQIEMKLLELKQILLECQTARTGGQDGPCVVYVPVAELKEKQRL